MSTSEPQREHPSTYFVQDRSNVDELTRLKIQDHLVTTSMGGPLIEQEDPARFRRVLDVACGTGGWLLEVARAYPDISLLIGVDVSGRMLEYARAQAEEQGMAERVEFVQMDALRMLEFPTGFFDLVNLRFGGSFLRTWDWPKLLQEFRRVLHPGGLVRLTEADELPGGNSPALARLFGFMQEAFYRAGHSFVEDGKGMTQVFLSLLEQHGFQQVQVRTFVTEYPATALEGQLYAEDMQRVFKTIVPFFRKWIKLPDDYEEIYQQALREMSQPDFVGQGVAFTAWGTSPSSPV